MWFNFLKAVQLFALVFASVAVLTASGMSYVYTGQDFTTVNSVYTTGDFVSARITFTDALAADMATQDLSASIQDWEIGDGHQMFSSALGSYLSAAFFGTDANANIDEWQLVVCDTAADCQGLPVNKEIVTYDLFPPTFATLVTDAGVDGELFGQNKNLPGTWSLFDAPQTAPEPATGFLLGAAGLFCLACRFWQRRRFYTA